MKLIVMIIIHKNKIINQIFVAKKKKINNQLVNADYANHVEEFINIMVALFLKIATIIL
jgi:hypothetical protein